MSAEEQSPYKIIGEEDGVRKLVDRFYFHMDTNPNAKRCRDLHLESLDIVSEKLVLFLQGWLGGPQTYVEKYGHPKMRKRHFPFKIGYRERDEWLLCMRDAIDDMKLDASFDNMLYQSFRQFAERMRNQD